MVPPPPTDRYALLYAVAREALVARSFDEVVVVALRSIGELLPAWRHSVGLIDERAGTFTVFSAAGNIDRLPPGSTIPLDQFGADVSRLRCGEVDLVQDVARRPDAVGSMEGSALRGQLIVPILRDGVLVGTLNVGADRPHHFSTEDVRVAGDLAELVGASLDQVGVRLALSEARDAALEANRAKSAFLANMSHELRTPLNIVLGYTDLLAEDATPEDAEDLGRIRAAGEHLLALVRDVLDLARVESGRLEVSLGPHEVEPLVRDLEASVRPLVAQRDNRWELDLAPDASCVVADALRLNQILLNLVSNAAKFTTAGTVGLTVRRVRHEVWFEVRDTGCGIAEADLCRMFEPFTQVHEPDGSVYGGTGLGLTIARRYARLMGGELQAESVLGEGSCFRLRLPACGTRR